MQIAIKDLFNAKLDKQLKANWWHLARLIFTYLVLFFLAVGSTYLIKELTVDTSLFKVLGLFKPNLWYDITAILLWIFLIFKIGFNLKKKIREIELLSCIRSIFFFLAYINYRSHFILVGFSFLDSNSIVFPLGYLDLIFVFFSFLLINTDKFSKSSEDSNLDNFLLEDLPIKDGTKDAYARKKYANEIANAIISTNPSESFGIAVKGKWGYGKSSFINLIVENLERDKKIKIIRFNPWDTQNESDLIKSLIDEIKGCFSFYQFDTLIEKYKNKVVSSDDFKYLKTINHLFFEEKSTAEYLNEINRLIEKIQVKIVILIDDLDRLTGKEIVSVYKLLHRIVNFKNTFFIAGLDMDYAIEAIEKTNEIGHGERYHEKIFSLEITLPPIREDWILDDLIELLPELNREKDFLKGLFFDVNDFNENNETDDFRIFLSSKRDLIKLVNSFKIVSKIISQDVVLTDLFILEVIKLRYPKVFEALALENLLEVNHQIQSTDISVENISYMVNPVKLERLIKDKLYGMEAERVLKFLLEERLFKYYGSKDFSAIVFKINHQTYFNFIELTRITVQEEKELWQRNVQNQVASIKNWLETKSTMNLGRILESRSNILTTFQEFIDFFELVVYLAKDDAQLIWYLINQLSKNEKWKSLIESNRDLFREFIKDRIINNDELNSINYFLIERILSASDRIDIKLFNKQDIHEFKQALLIKFKNAIDKTYKLNYEIVRNLYSNLESVEKESNRIILSNEALKFFRKAIDEENFKHDFLVMQCRPRTTPPNNEYVFDPFNYQIFGLNGANWIDEFSNYVDSYNADNEVKVKLKNILVTYISQLKNHNSQSDFTFEPTPDEIQFIKDLQVPYLE